jgi:hypothetical protein
MLFAVDQLGKPVAAGMDLCQIWQVFLRQRAPTPLIFSNLSLALPLQCPARSPRFYHRWAYNFSLEVTMKRHTIILVSLFALSPSLCSCAASMAAWREAYCNYDGAYKLGMNDARSGKEMSGAVSMHCPLPGRAAVEQGYREGYTAGATPGAGGVALSGEPWQCKSAYGQKACGYHCLTAYGNVACASQPDENCLQAYGQLRCGHHCRAEFGQIVCD